MARARFKNNSMRLIQVPQGLKPNFFRGGLRTTEEAAEKLRKKGDGQAKQQEVLSSGAKSLSVNSDEIGSGD